MSRPSTEYLLASVYGSVVSSARVMLRPPMGMGQMQHMGRKRTPPERSGEQQYHATSSPSKYRPACVGNNEHMLQANEKQNPRVTPTSQPLIGRPAGRPASRPAIARAGNAAWSLGAPVPPSSTLLLTSKYVGPNPLRWYPFRHFVVGIRHQGIPIQAA